MKGLLCAVLLLSGCRGPQAPDEGRPVPGAELAVPVPKAAPGPVAVRVSFPDGSSIAAEAADSPEERERGLMDRLKMGPDDGMLFIFDAEQQLGFWMKNTFVDLDMVWLDAQGKVTAVHADVPRSKPGMRDDEVATRSGWGLYVLELAAGQARRRKVVKGSTLGLEFSEAAR
ncbi:MAG: DUF192 domain-containing protein [Elusimicrobia bacterium]|nr:DUF192 domain-containing protein [Elusimicrobiota bacterium]